MAPGPKNNDADTAVTETTVSQLPLDEVMMAMDVVDTLRHRKLLVDRELHSDEREQILINRLRELYRSQGIEVSDKVLAEGVKALEDDRFTYKPPRGRGVGLARFYVERGKWSKRVGIALLALGICWAGYYLLLKAPEIRAVEQQVAVLNEEIREGASNLDMLEQQIVRLGNLLESSENRGGDKLAVAYERARRSADSHLAQAKEYALAAKSMGLSPDFDRDNFTSESGVARQRLGQQRDLVSSVKTSLAEANKEIETLSALNELPTALAAELEAVRENARDENVVGHAADLYRAGENALRTGDIQAAGNVYQDLKSLRKQLISGYQIRVVSRPDENSGVWRVPEDNPGAKNYYLVVEAIDSDGKAMTLPIYNEEDGMTRLVDKWGLRVSEMTFRLVAEDKQDDGIIQSRDVGSKQPGYLEPDYTIPTNGATITSW